MQVDGKLTRKQYFKDFFDQIRTILHGPDPHNPDEIPIIIDANKTAWTTHGYSQNDFIGKPVTDVDDTKAKKSCIERTQLILRGKLLRIENTHVRKDG